MKPIPTTWVLEPAEPVRRVIAAIDWPEYHSWPPIGGLRHLIFNARYNGFDRVVRRVGRRVLIDEQSFFQWVDAANTATTK